MKFNTLGSINNLLELLKFDNLQVIIQEEEKYGEPRFNVHLKSGDGESRMSYRDDYKDTESRLEAIHDFLVAIYHLNIESK